MRKSKNNNNNKNMKNNNNNNQDNILGKLIQVDPLKVLLPKDYTKIEIIDTKATTSRLMGVYGMVSKGILKKKNATYLLIQNYYIDATEDYIDSFEEILFEVKDLDIFSYLKKRDSLDDFEAKEYAKTINIEVSLIPSSIEDNLRVLIASEENSMPTQIKTEHIKNFDNLSKINISLYDVFCPNPEIDSNINPYEIVKFGAFGEPFTRLSIESACSIITYLLIPYLETTSFDTLPLKLYQAYMIKFCPKSFEKMEDAILRGMATLCVEPENPFELINYFLMRLSSGDEEPILTLISLESELDFDVIKSSPKAYLLENSTKEVKESNTETTKNDILQKFMSTAIIEYPEETIKYKLEFEVEELKILSVSKISESKIKTYKAYGTSKNLYVTDFDSKELINQCSKKLGKDFKIKYQSYILQLIHQAYPSVILNRQKDSFTALIFNENNDHVKDKKFILAHDLFGEIHISKDKNLFIASRYIRNIEYIIRHLSVAAYLNDIDFPYQHILDEVIMGNEEVGLFGKQNIVYKKVPQNILSEYIVSPEKTLKSFFEN